MSKRGPASLTSSLLAEKGAAAPTVGQAARPADPATMPPPPAFDLPAAAPPTHPPHAAALDDSAPRRGKASRVRVTMRIDPERHFRLRLVAAHLNQSTQDVLSLALDAYLDQVAPAVSNSAGGNPVAGERGRVPHTMYRLNPSDVAGTTEIVTRPRRAPKDPKIR